MRETGAEPLEITPREDHLHACVKKTEHFVNCWLEAPRFVGPNAEGVGVPAIVFFSPSHHDFRSPSHDTSRQLAKWYRAAAGAASHLFAGMITTMEHSGTHLGALCHQAEGHPVRKLIGAELAKHESTETFALEGETVAVPQMSKEQWKAVLAQRKKKDAKRVRYLKLKEGDGEKLVEVRVFTDPQHIKDPVPAEWLQ
jgi:hypothetical protein